MKLITSDMLLMASHLQNNLQLSHLGVLTGNWKTPLKYIYDIS